MAHQDLRPGDPESFGRFTLTGRLGAGGMGVAFSAETEDGQRVVVKTVLSDLAGYAEYRARFRREVLAASSLESPFISQVLASDISADRQWVAIEYVEGPTLAELVASEGPLGRPKQLAIAIGLADGLAQLHRAGLIHRDLKPANIICSAAGPRLIDFGIAVVQQLPNVTRTGGLAPGSPGWMAPEQLDPFAVPTPAVDLFAWGCVCWYAATGVSPLAAPDVRASMDALRGWSADQAQIPPSVAPEIAPWVRRALSSQPSQRGSAASYAAGLSTELGDIEATQELVRDAWHDTLSLDAATQPSTVRAQTPDGPSRSATRRWTVLLSAFAAAAAAVIAVAAAHFIGDSDQKGSGTVAPAAHGEGTQLPQATVTETDEADEGSTPSDDSQTTDAATPTASPTAALPPLPGYGGAHRAGYGAVKLGMTRRQLLATGEAVDVPRTPMFACTDYPLTAGGTAGFSENLKRVVYIRFARKMSTSAGIHVDSTRREALQAYPGIPVDPYTGALTPAVAEHVHYYIAFGGGYVSDLVLLTDLQDCAE